MRPLVVFPMSTLPCRFVTIDVLVGAAPLGSIEPNVAYCNLTPDVQTQLSVSEGSGIVRIQTDSSRSVDLLFDTINIFARSEWDRPIE